MHQQRFIRTAILLLCVAFAPGLSTTALAAAQETSQPPAELLEAAAQEMLALETFHFAVSTPVGETLLADEVELSGIEGDVQRPDAFQATFTVELGFVALDLQAIGIGADLWVSDPTSGDGQFIQVAGEGEATLPPTALLNPDELILQAVSLLRDPVVKGTGRIDDVEVVNIEGIFDPKDLESLGTPVPEELFETIEPLEVNLWIDGDNRIVRAEFAGALLPSEREAGRIVRRVDLSAFNEPVTIEAPEDRA